MVSSSDDEDFSDVEGRLFLDLRRATVYRTNSGIPLGQRDLPAPPSQRQRTRYVRLEELDRFFGIVHDILSGQLYQSIPAYREIIPREEFVVVSQSFFSERINRVTSSRVEGAVDAGTPLIKVLADVINSYGEVVTHDGALQMIVERESSASWQQAVRRVNDDMMNDYDTFTNACERNDLSRTGTLSTSSSGSMASFLSARKLNEVEMATAETPTVWVQSQVKKYSRRDALLAAVMVNGFDGNILGTNQLFFTNVFRDMAFHRRWAIANL